MNYYFTSASKAQLASARVLAESVKKFNDSSIFILLFNDIEADDFDWQSEPFDEIVHSHKLGLNNYFQAVAQFSEDTFCGAIRAFFARFLLENYPASQVTYLDPMCEVFCSLCEFQNLHENHDIVLTPYITNALELEPHIYFNGLGSATPKIFNSGFFSVSNSPNGKRFLDWWDQQVLPRSVEALKQKVVEDINYLDHAPYLFDCVHVLSDPAFCTGIWSSRTRAITNVENSWLVDQKQLAVYHFSGIHNVHDGSYQLGLNRDDHTVNFLKEYSEKCLDKSDAAQDGSAWYWGRLEGNISSLESGSISSRVRYGDTNRVIGDFESSAFSR